jgi:Fe2+/Zn2+ uptake regulation proteins
MREKSKYQTKQREYLLDYLSKKADSHVTALQIAAHFKENGIQVGTTTVYRQLEKLVAEGIVQKLVTDGGACFQYVGEEDGAHAHYHMKCVSCGKLLHMHCGELKRLQNHIRHEHSFEIQPLKTTFYGECGNCLEEK